MSSHETNLAILASKAAIALDKKARGLEVSLDPVRSLGEELRGRVTATPGRSGAAKLLDPLTSDLLTRAMIGSEVHSLPELSKHATEVVEKLFSASSEERVDELRSLRDFCVALSRSAQAGYAISMTSIPAHPFRQ